MKKITPKQEREILRKWFYKNPSSRYYRFCLYCNHRGRQGECESFCYWYGRDCFDAMRMMCPIPTAMVSMLLTDEARTPAQDSMNSMEEKDICGIEKMKSNTEVKI